MTKRIPRRLPWDIDLRDREHPRRQPIPVAERVRLLLKGAVVGGAFLLARWRMSDGEHQGAALMVALGMAMAAIAAIDLIFLPGQTDAHRIFLRTKMQVGLVLAGALTAGLILVALGLARGA